MDWINDIKTNENEALRKIYQQYRGSCVSWIGREWNISGEDAIEIFQLSVVILYDNVITGKLSQLNSDIKSYLYSIARNKARELVRKNKREQSLKDQHPIVSYVSSEIDDKAILEENINKANQALEELGDPCKSLLQLFYYKQMRMDDIVTLMGYKNRDTVKNQKYKCLKRLQKIYFSHIKAESVERS